MALKDDKFGNIWIATHGNGFCRYNPSKKVINHCLYISCFTSGYGKE